MAINPMEMMKYAARMRKFQEQHPKAIAFLQFVGQNAIQEGSVIAVKVTDPEGKEYESNIKITADDLETVQMLKNMKQN
jgi:hypothetical protein